MRTDGLFMRGEHPSPEMRAKMSLAQRKRWEQSRDQRWLAEFLVKVQTLLDECYAQMKQQ